MNIQLKLTYTKIDYMKQKNPVKNYYQLLHMFIISFIQYYHKQNWFIKQMILMNNKHKYKFKAILANVLVICIGLFLFGFIMIYASIIPIQLIINQYQISIQKSVVQGIMSGTMSLGNFTGSIFTRFILPKYSRRDSLIISGIIGILGGTLIQITNIIPLLLGRFLQGLCGGLLATISPIYIKQITPIQIYGSIGSLSQVSMILGVITVNLFSMFVKVKVSEIHQITQSPIWRYIFGIPVLLIIIYIICLICIFNNETPKYLLQNHRYLQARKLIHQFYEDEYVEIVIQILQNDIKITQECNRRGQDNMIPVFFAYFMYIFIGFSGINIIVAYGTRLIKTLLPVGGAVIQGFLNIIQLIASIWSIYQLKKLGRKYAMQIGISILLISFLVIGTCFLEPLKQNNQITMINKIFIISAIFVFIGGYGATVGAIVWQYGPEIVSPKILSNARSMNALCSTCSVILYPILTARIGESPIFYGISLIYVIGLAINHKYMIETKDKTQSQIKEQFDRLIDQRWCWSRQILHLQMLTNVANQENDQLI